MRFRRLFSALLATLALSVAAGDNLLQDDKWEISNPNQAERLADGVWQLKAPDANSPVTLRQEIVLNQTEAMPITFGAVARNIENDFHRRESTHGVYMNLTLDNGQRISCVVVAPDPKRRDWEELRRTYQPSRPVKKAVFVVSFAARPGTVQFKDIFMKVEKPLGTAGMKSHGIGVDDAELRHCVGGIDAKGRPFVLAAPYDADERNYLLYTELDTNKTFQYFLPVNGGFISGAVLTDQGKYVCCLGDQVVIFDVNSRTATLGSASAPGIAWTATPGNDGTIYFGNTPGMLFAVNPDTGEVKNCGRVDPVETQVYWIAVDREDWIYCGVGVARAGVVAYHPASGEMRQLVADEDRVTGSGVAIRDREGMVYISTPSGYSARYLGGELVAENVERPEEPFHRNLKFGSRNFHIDADRKIIQYSITNREISWADRGEAKKVPFAYTSGGASLTSVAAGPDGRVYISSAHPHHLVAFDPAVGKLSDYGAHPVVTGGNFCNMTPHNGKLYSCAYPGGRLWEFDPAQPSSYRKANPRNSDDYGNPRILGRWPEAVMRPREVLVHPNGREVVISGFSHDGISGGQFGVHDLVTGENRAITEWLPGESCIAGVFSPTGNLLGGSSIGSTGGRVIATEASLFELEWPECNVVKNLRLPGARNVFAVALWRGKLLAAADNGNLYVVNPDTFAIENRYPIGMPVRNALLETADDRMFLLQSSQISELDGDTFKPEALAQPLKPITGGGAAVDGHLYFLAGKVEFHSYEIPPKPAKFERRVLKNALPRPDWWRVRPDEIVADCAAVKQGKSEVVAQTPGGFPVYAVTYGSEPTERRRVNWPSATGSPRPRLYADNSPQIVMLVAGIHGEEPEGVALLSNLISLLETGRDHRGVERPRLVELCRKYRLVLMPCVNMDGRTISPDNALGGEFEDFAELAYTRLNDGTQLRWPALKEYFPMPMDQVKQLGTYYNSEGYNIQLDATPGDIRTAEARALLKLAADERVDFLLNIHSAPGAKASFVFRPSTLNYPGNIKTLLEVRKAWMLKRGLSLAPADDTPSPGRQSDINTAVMLGTGAATMTFEFASMQEENFDKLLETGYSIVEAILEYGLEHCLADRQEVLRGK